MSRPQVDIQRRIHCGESKDGHGVCTIRMWLGVTARDQGKLKLVVQAFWLNRPYLSNIKPSSSRTYYDVRYPPAHDYKGIRQIPHLASPILTSANPQVFRKFSNSLGPDTLQFIDKILDTHEIEDIDVESSLETLAKEYNKQDGWIILISLDD